MNLLDLIFPGLRQRKPPVPTIGINKQPIAEVHGTNYRAGSTLPRGDVRHRMGISTRFGGAGGNAGGKRR